MPNLAIDTVSFSEPDYIYNDDVKLAVYIYRAVDGCETKPPVVLCHGFPEIAYAWRFQVSFLNREGYTVIVPDFRGYGDSDKPDNYEEYSQEMVQSDLCCILDYYEFEDAIFIGHDFGGSICWGMALYKKARVRALITSSSPFPDMQFNPLDVCRLLYGEDNYFTYFHTDEAVNELNSDISKTISFYMRLDTGEGTNLSQSGKKDAHTMSHPKRLHMDECWKGELFLSSDELSYYVDKFSQSGFLGPLSWYRCIKHEFIRQSRLFSNGIPTIDIPVLSIGSELDYVVPSESCNNLKSYCSNYEFVMLKAVGHWANQEKPYYYNEIVNSWLSKTTV